MPLPRSSTAAGRRAIRTAEPGDRPAPGRAHDASRAGPATAARAALRMVNGRDVPVPSRTGRHAPPCLRSSALRVALARFIAVRGSTARAEFTDVQRHLCRPAAHGAPALRVRHRRDGRRGRGRRAALTAFDDPRPGGRHGVPHRAADRGPARRPDGDRRRRNPAQRRAEPAAAAAAAARRRGHDQRRRGLDVGCVPARREPRPDAGAGRRPARRVVVGRRDVAGGDPARADRAHRDPARAGVEPVRRGRDRRRHPGLHEARGWHGVRGQRERRLRHVGHEECERGTARGAGAARLLAAGGRHEERRLQRDREPGQP